MKYFPVVLILILSTIALAVEPQVVTPPAPAPETGICNLDKNGLLDDFTLGGSKLLRVINSLNDINQELFLGDQGVRLLRSPITRDKATIVVDNLRRFQREGVDFRIKTRPIIEIVNEGLGAYKHNASFFNEFVPKLVDGTSLEKTKTLIKRVREIQAEVAVFKGELATQHKNLISSSSWWKPQKTEIAELKSGKDAVPEVESILARYNRGLGEFLTALNEVTRLYQQALEPALP